ncbi:MAG: ATP-grasp domain-containing protein [Solirubrobacterales bacterium]|nr:ATP-grasp domain-containing protein [Solirubrobacterales bacterium]
MSEAARDVCELIWVLDAQFGPIDRLTRVLKRVGTVIDVTGLTPAAAAARIGAESPDGILALSDTRLVWTAAVARELDLDFLSVETATALTDKSAQRAALAAGGVEVPDVWLISDPGARAAVDELAANATFPAILKPRSGEASRDTVRVDSAEQLRAELALVDGAREAPEPMILEGYLRDRSEKAGEAFADYVSVESIVGGGVTTHLTITGRFPPAPPFRESGFFMPSALNAADQEGVLAAASAALRALGIHVGSVHTEVKLTPEGPRVIEVNGRIGGGVPEMLGAVSGFDLMRETLKLALGGTAPARGPELDRVGFLFYVQAPADMRTVTAVDGLDVLAAEPGVEEVILNRAPGDSVDWREGNHGHVFSARGVAGDHHELQSIARQIPELVAIHGT